MKSILHVGVDAEKVAPSASVLKESLIAILNTSAGDAVKIAAIQALGAMFKVENINIADCQLNNAVDVKPGPTENVGSCHPQGPGSAQQAPFDPKRWV